MVLLSDLPAYFRKTSSKLGLDNVTPCASRFFACWFVKVWYYLLRSEPQLGQNAVVVVSCLPQLGQKDIFGCLNSGLSEGGAGTAGGGGVAFGVSYVTGWDRF